MRKIIGFVLLALSPVLTACRGTVIVDAPISNLNYTVDDFEYAARNGEIRTRVGRNPFGGAHDPFAARVMEHMFGANFGVEVAFTPSPKGKSSGRHHVLLLFNPRSARMRRIFAGIM